MYDLEMHAMYDKTSYKGYFKQDSLTWSNWSDFKIMQPEVDILDLVFRLCSETVDDNIYTWKTQIVA